MKGLRRIVVFGLIYTVGYFVWELARGLWLTAAYTPETSAQWENVSYLQNEVAFGRTVGGFPFLPFFVILSLAIASSLIWRKRGIKRAS
ncbi:hypothetical protein LC040_02500 [Bacillus tianshenii]|nr:hypothetical protein LC040_02500 [Bacillus tianshenii]